MHISAEIRIKPEEHAVFENAQIEVPVWGGIPPSTAGRIVSRAMRRRAAVDSIATAQSAGLCCGLYVAYYMP